MNDFYRVIPDASARKVKRVERERAIRLYRSQAWAGGVWRLQVRAPEQLANQGEGKAFIVASASLDRDAMTALRDALTAELERTET